MSDWLGEIKKRMKGPMIAASMTNRVRHDMERLISEIERFQQKDGLRTREHNILVQENRNLTATIATLREALISRRVLGTPEDPCFQYCQAHWMPEHTPDCQSMRKALATAQEAP